VKRHLGSLAAATGLVLAAFGVGGVAIHLIQPDCSIVNTFQLQIVISCNRHPAPPHPLKFQIRYGGGRIPLSRK